MGEPYYTYGSGWAWGAWMSATNCLSRNLAKLVPGLTDQIQHYLSGCSGASLPFPNEVFMPTASFPGLSLDGPTKEVSAVAKVTSVRAAAAADVPLQRFRP